MATGTVSRPHFSSVLTKKRWRTSFAGAFSLAPGRCASFGASFGDVFVREEALELNHAGDPR